MIIRHNKAALAAHRNYLNNLARVSLAMERLSSGYRINRAADDPAGLCISEKMRAQIGGLNMASKNSQDAISLVQTAEGALDETHAILQRMNEIAVQAATGTNESLDRAALAKEFEQLKREINDIAGQTTFNNMNLLDGSLSYSGPVRSAATAGVNLSVSSDTDPAERTYTLEFDYAKLQDGDQISFQIGDQNISVTKQAGDTRGSFLDRLRSQVAEAGGRVNGNAVLSTGTAISEPIFKSGPQSESNALRIQVGAQENQQLNISIDCMNTAALGLDGVNLNDQDAAGRAISAVRNAIAKVSDQRTTLGAMHNRLDFKISNLKNTAINLSDAESRIRDTDMAAEMMELVKAQILTQVSIAIMAQCNGLNYNILSLLG
ncbi:MAG: flagellin [Clostridia bacterium]|nr:flagellin [Clostridia bacterium]